MPLPIVELVGKVKDFFDYLVIATPYHDLASEQWRDTSWKRSIDPFLFGFLKQRPELMFFSGAVVRNRPFSTSDRYDRRYD